MGSQSDEGFPRINAGPLCLGTVVAQPVIEQGDIERFDGYLFLKFTVVLKITLVTLNLVEHLNAVLTHITVNVPPVVNGNSLSNN